MSVRTAPAGLGNLESRLPVLAPFRERRAALIPAIHAGTGAVGASPTPGRAAWGTGVSDIPVRTRPSGPVLRTLRSGLLGTVQGALAP